MIRGCLVLILVCWTAISAAAQATAQSTIAHPTTQGRVVESSRAVLEAQKTKNPDAIKRLLAEDFTMIGSDGKVQDSDELIDNAREGRVQNYQIYNVKVIDVDDQAILVTYDLIITATEGDNVLVPRYQHISDLWTKSGDQKSGDQWRLKFEQATAARHID
jgi:hypothetical protein